MSETLYDEGEGFHIGSFWGGKCAGVQFTISHEAGYFQMPRAKAIAVLAIVLKKLRAQERAAGYKK